jgi:hypothetical protein
VSNGEWTAAHELHVPECRLLCTRVMAAFWLVVDCRHGFSVAACV